MTLIAILISLTIERFLGCLQEYRRFGWFRRFADWVRTRAGVLDGPLGVLLAVGAVLLVVGVIQNKLGETSGLLSFLFGVAVLVLSLGPKTFYDRVKDYLGAVERGNTESACWYAGEILGRKVSANDEAALTRGVAESLFVIAHDRILAVIFWFAILGPLGAAFYRLTSILRTPPAGEEEVAQRTRFDASAAQLNFILAWVPARLAVLGYAVIGSFVDALGYCRNKTQECSERWSDANDRLLVCAGTGALRLGLQPEEGATAADNVREVHDALALVRRSIAVWLAVIALMTLSGWAA